MADTLSGNAEQADQDDDTPRAIRVRSVKDARRLLAKILRQLQRGEISESRARTISYVANSYAKLFEVSELEERVEKLEESSSIKR